MPLNQNFPERTSRCFIDEVEDLVDVLFLPGRQVPSKLDQLKFYLVVKTVEFTVELSVVEDALIFCLEIVLLQTLTPARQPHNRLRIGIDFQVAL